MSLRPLGRRPPPSTIPSSSRDRRRAEERRPRAEEGIAGACVIAASTRRGRKDPGPQGFGVSPAVRVSFREQRRQGGPAERAEQVAATLGGASLFVESSRQLF